MKQIAAGEFKAHCLALMDEVAATREAVVITKRGTPIARLLPIEERPIEIRNRCQGIITIAGDLLEPAVPLEDYESLR